jgi:hypothetical protein
MVKRSLIFVHRWLGVALAAVFLLWFVSGIGMMYWTYPTVTAADRLARSTALDPARVVLSPAEAARRIGIERPSPAQIRLNSFDGRPVYRFGGGRGASGRGGGERIVYADTGEEQGEVSRFQRNRIAAAWTGQPADQARVESIREVDQWTVQAGLRDIRPLYKYSWANGEQVYVNGRSGEVVQYTTRGSRLAAHVSAIPHWVYYTPLRKRQPVWIRFMIWSAGIGTVGATIGVIIGVWMYSPRKKYRLSGAPASVPYRGQKRWHMIFGLLFGVATATWAFSGMLSLDPFPRVDRRPPQGPVVGRRGPGVAAALRGRVTMEDFAAAHPRDVLAKNGSLKIKELEFTSFAGEPVFGVHVDGRTRMVALDGRPIPEFDRQRIIDIVKGVAPDPKAVETRVHDQYDLYYLDRRRERPLPVILALMNDEEQTRYYIDPRTARVVGTYSDQDWVGRWLYNGLHSLNFPWLYNYRPLWDVVVIGFMLGGTALSVTSLVLAWRVLGRKLRAATRAAPAGALAAEGGSSL